MAWLTQVPGSRVALAPNGDRSVARRVDREQPRIAVSWVNIPPAHELQADTTVRIAAAWSGHIADLVDDCGVPSRRGRWFRCPAGTLQLPPSCSPRPIQHILTDAAVESIEEITRSYRAAVDADLVRSARSRRRDTIALAQSSRRDQAPHAAQ